MTYKYSKQRGFTAIELLITLFIAAAFLVSGYQLYSVIIKDSGNTRAQTRASNVAYDYLRRYSSSATNPCSASSPLVDSEVSIAGLSSTTVSVDLTCPYSGSTNLSKVSVTVKYNNPQQTVTYSTYANAGIADTSGSSLENGLIGWWKFNGDAKDSAGSNDATVNNAILAVGQSGQSDTAYSFNGTSSYLLASTTDWPTTLSTISVSFWAIVSTSGSTSVLFATPDETTNRLNLHFPWGGTDIYWDFGNISTVGRLNMSYSTSYSNSWAHWVFIAESGVGMRIYRNGALAASSSTSSSFAHGTKSLNIGSTGSGSWWKGILDDLRIYSRALSTSEISSLYSEGAK